MVLQMLDEQTMIPYGIIDHFGHSSEVHAAEFVHCFQIPMLVLLATIKKAKHPSDIIREAFLFSIHTTPPQPCRNHRYRSECMMFSDQLSLTQQ